MTAGRIILICGDQHVGIVKRLMVATKELGHDVIFVDSPPVEREYLHRRDLLTEQFNRLLTEPPRLMLPKQSKQADRRRIKDRWGRYK